jgi:Tol biopolymer transport system component
VRLSRIILTAGLLLCLFAAPAHAAFPGANGKIAFTAHWDVNDVSNSEVATINPDGTGLTDLTNSPGFDGRPQWSPDGTKIAFITRRNGNLDIYVMDPNGGNETPLAASPGTDYDPHWSADGTRIAFTSDRDGSDEIYVMDADGSDQTRLTNHPDRDFGATWSPDGTKLVFTRNAPFPTQADIYTVAIDGSPPTLLTGGSQAPDTHDNFAGGGTTDGSAWSPDGGKIAYRVPAEELWTMNPDGGGKHQLVRWRADADFRGWAPTGSSRILVGGDAQGTFDESWTMNRDGTNLQRLTNDIDLQGDEAWSPDAAYVTGATENCENEPNPCTPLRLFVVRSDGTGLAVFGEGRWPDWQPIPINAYPRPIATEPLKATMAVAYEPCTSPNRTHGPPLDSPSCAPPAKTSGQLTVGTFDANGRNPNAVANVILTQVVGNPNTSADEADIALHAEATDVRLASDLSDYTGSLEARMNLRITDKDNTPSPGGPGAATVKDMPYSFSVPCATTPAAGIGSSCGVDTTADTLVPGTVKEKRRTVWALGQVVLRDGAGNVFMRQGLFVP